MAPLYNDFAGYAGNMVLRLIALFKAVKGALLLVVGFGILRLVHRDVWAFAIAWADRLSLDPQNRYVDVLLNRLSSVDERTLASLGVGSFCYAALLLTEAIGLWLERRWAEYFTIIVTGSFVPLELYELTRRFTAARLGILVVNVAIVLYLAHNLRVTRHAPLGEPA
jgi:uncharacterized membrane protein (DUF2068 family)